MSDDSSLCFSNSEFTSDSCLCYVTLEDRDHRHVPSGWRRGMMRVTSSGDDHVTVHRVRQGYHRVVASISGYFVMIDNSEKGNVNKTQTQSQYNSLISQGHDMIISHFSVSYSVSSCWDLVGAGPGDIWD